MDPLLQLPSNLDRAHLEMESSLRASGVRLQISSREYCRRKSEKDILEDRAEGVTYRAPGDEALVVRRWKEVKFYQNSPSSER